jgi:hypothetical protein
MTVISSSSIILTAHKNPHSNSLNERMYDLVRPFSVYAHCDFSNHNSIRDTTNN